MSKLLGDAFEACKKQTLHKLIPLRDAILMQCLENKILEFENEKFSIKNWRPTEKSLCCPQCGTNIMSLMKEIK